MSKGYITCHYCQSQSEAEQLEEFEGVDTFMYHCPHCFELLATRAYPEYEPDPNPVPEPEPAPCQKRPLRDFSLSSDELRYTIHCLGKQANKLDHARKQLSTTIAKLEIMLEIEKEERNDC